MDWQAEVDLTKRLRKRSVRRSINSKPKVAVKAKTKREEAAYQAGRVDAQVLCNLYFAGTGILPPILTGEEGMFDFKSFANALERSATGAEAQLKMAETDDEKLRLKIVSDMTHILLNAVREAKT